MFTGIIWAVLAGTMLGLYALPEKYVKGYKYENTWSVFFFFALIVFPMILGFGLIDHFGEILSDIPSNILLIMMLTSFFWGVGVQLWSKAINYIGVSLGFSIFIGVVIIIGSLLPFIVDEVPDTDALTMIIIGLLVILLGLIINGRAGVVRQEVSQKNEHVEQLSHGKTLKGIFIALVGGIFATGFSLANAVGSSKITELTVAAGNPQWKSSIAIMFIVYVSGAIYVLPYFVIKLTKNKTWKEFKGHHLGYNLCLTGLMGFMNFIASVLFAYAAFSLGKQGNTVGYAIYNTVSVLFAVIGGLVAKEWVDASLKARRLLYLASIIMVLGVIIISYGNSLVR